jgi:sulfate adenylyltransferase subunit 1 (EFTu-like GTPase family)
VWRAGDEVVVLPSGRRSRVASVDTADGPIEFAAPPMSVTIRLEDDLDVGRGDLLGDPADPPVAARELEARICWMSEDPLEPRARLAIKAGTRWSRAIVDEIASVVDMETLDDVPAERMELNDIGVVRLRLAEPLPVDPYARNRTTGAFVLADEATNDTVAAGMVLSAVGEPMVPPRAPSFSE